MIDGLRGRLTYANVMATMAMFVALGGGAWAVATISAGDIKKNAVRSKHIKAANVKRSDIGANAVDSPRLADGSVTTPKIADDAVTFGKIADDAVTFGKIADDAVYGHHIVDGAISGREFFAQGGALLDFPTIDSGTCSSLTEQRQGTSEAHFLVTPPDHFADTFTLTGKIDAVSLGIVQYKFVACNVFGGGGAADPDSSGGTYRYLVVYVG